MAHLLFVKEFSPWHEHFFQGDIIQTFHFIIASHLLNRSLYVKLNPIDMLNPP